VVLNWLLYLPLLGGLAALALPRPRWLPRALAFTACAADFLLAVIAWHTTGGGANPLHLRAPWVPQFGISYHLSLDGLSLLLILLTGLLGMVAVLSSWREITDRVGAYHLALLSTLTGVIGVFLARDLALFVFFWELMLVPMYLLIGVWGHEGRRRAATRFFLFTFASGLLMFGAILALAFLHLRATSVLTFDAQALLATPLHRSTATWLMLGFFVAFAVKLPVPPLHPWLADAHTEAPTGGSIILAGLLLKTGAYGMIRFALPLFPQVSHGFAPIACWLGAAGVIYGGLLAFAQSDLKRLIAYTSISHMGFVLIGVYTGSRIALEGAVIQMLAHGLSTPALFLLAGSTRERCRTLDLTRLGGLREVAPRLGGFTLFFVMAALGLPGLANFLGEFLVLLGAYMVRPAVAVVGAGGFIVSVVYAVRIVQHTIHGPNQEPWRVRDLSARELGALAVLAALVLGLGLYPRPVVRADPSALKAVQQVLTGEAQR
jgi:NADH-quinone oxidoreductase subunit M